MVLLGNGYVNNINEYHQFQLLKKNEIINLSSYCQKHQKAIHEYGLYKHEKTTEFNTTNLFREKKDIISMYNEFKNDSESNSSKSDYKSRNPD
jgi:hypothetical protein